MSAVRDAESARAQAANLAGEGRGDRARELGYLALPAGAAELVFQVISERNERASMEANG